jgi:hypothetical protein
MEFRDSKLKILGIAIICLAFAVPLVLVLRIDIGRDAYVLVFFEVIGIIFFASLAVIALMRIVVPKREPEMVIDAQGIKGWISKGYVPWSRIVFLWVTKDTLRPGANFFHKLLYWLSPERVIVCRHTPDKSKRFSATKSAAQSEALTPDDEDYDDHDIDWIETTIRFRGWTPGVDDAISTIRSLHASKLVYEKPKEARRGLIQT